MRAFVIALISMTLVVGISLVCASGIASVCDELERKLDAIAPNSEADATALEQSWSRHEAFFSAFAGHAPADEITDAIGNMRASIASGDIGLFFIYKSSVRSALDKVRQRQTLSLDSII